MLFLLRLEKAQFRWGGVLVRSGETGLVISPWLQGDVV